MLKRIAHILVICVLMSAALQGFAAEPNEASVTPESADRFLNLTQEIRCVVCQNQNIADSNAPLAADLRAKVYQLMQANKTDQEIKDYLVARYGDFILLKPPLKLTTLSLWLFPFIGLTLIPLFLYRFFRPSRDRT